MMNYCFRYSTRFAPQLLLLIGFFYSFTAGISSSNLVPSAAAQTATQADSANHPKLVIIIRHGEKPPKGDPSPDLIPAGFERAKHLPELFLGPSARFPRPDAIFATHKSAHSDREVETVIPLSAALHLPISHDFNEDDVKPLADTILSGAYAGKVVLICWHHGKIPALAQAFGINSAPKWPDDIFNRVWEITWVDGKPNLSIRQQALMPSDPAN